MLNQKLQQKLLQKLSPQQIQLMKLLQLPAIALEQRIKQEIEENPALEDATDETELPENENAEAFDSDGTPDDDGDSDDNTEAEIEEKESAPEEISLEEYIDEDDTPAYKLSTYEYNPDEEERREIPFASSQSFQENLITQLGLRKLTPKQYEIARFIIGNLDDSGYLQREINAMVDDLAFTQNLTATAAEVEEMVKLIQEFEPYGVGARDLRECLIIQLERRETHNPAVEKALLILKKYFNEFTRKHYEKITRKGEFSDDELRAAINEILKLNPKPGSSMIDSSRPNHFIVPDFIITNNDGVLELSLNARNAPELRINRQYSEMLEHFVADKNSKKSSQERDLMVFIKQKLDSARWFIDMIRQRHDTLTRTMKAIMEYQHDYFLEGDETRLKPMILKDIAEMVNLDISTI